VTDANVSRASYEQPAPAAGGWKAR
jgi:hypothetical protein